MFRKGFRKDLLFFLAFVVDEFTDDYYRHKLTKELYEGYYSKSTLRRSLSHLLTIGDIEKTESKGKVSYRLTSEGRTKIKKEIPVLRFSNKKWDGYWRIVIFDIPEKNKAIREALRRKLTSLGFASWQKSVYIIPHDINDEINQYFMSNGLADTCICLTAKSSGLVNDRALAVKVWELNKLNNKYRKILDRCKNLDNDNKNKKKHLIREIWFNYQNLISIDPFLPKELLPNNWLRDKVKDALLSLNN